MNRTLRTLALGATLALGCGGLGLRNDAGVGDGGASALPCPRANVVSCETTGYGDGGAVVAHTCVEESSTGDASGKAAADQFAANCMAANSPPGQRTTVGTGCARTNVATGCAVDPGTGTLCHTTLDYTDDASKVADDDQQCTLRGGTVVTM